MHNLGTITPDQIASTCKKHVCHYFYLTDVNGTTRHVQIGAKKDLDKKIAEAVQTISSLQDQVFRIVFLKSTSGTDKAEYCYYLSKTPQSANAPAQQPQTIINTPFEPARSMSEALKDAHEMATLRADNKRLQDEVNRLTAECGELRAEAMAEEESKELAAAPNGIDKAAGFMKEILPQFLPIADKYFELAEKKLQLQALALSQRPQQPAQQPRKKHPFRPFPNPETETERTQQYLTWLESVPDNVFKMEIIAAKTQAPALYTILEQEFNTPNDGEEVNS